MRLLSLLHYDKRCLEGYGVVWTLMRPPSSSSNSQDSPSVTSALFLQQQKWLFLGCKYFRSSLYISAHSVERTSLCVLNIPPSTGLYRSFYLMCAYFYVSVCCIDCGCTVPPAEEERLISAPVLRASSWCCGLHTVCCVSYLHVSSCGVLYHTHCVCGESHIYATLVCCGVPHPALWRIPE